MNTQNLCNILNPLKQFKWELSLHKQHVVNLKMWFQNAEEQALWQYALNSKYSKMVIIYPHNILNDEQELKATIWQHLGPFSQVLTPEVKGFILGSS